MESSSFEQSRFVGLHIKFCQNQFIYCSYQQHDPVNQNSSIEIIFIIIIKSQMFDLTGQDKLYLIFGGAIVSIAYALDSSLKKQAMKNKSTMENIKKWRSQSEKWPFYDELRSEKNVGKKYNVVIQKATPSFKNDSLSIRVRELPLHIRHVSQYFQNISGGTLNFNYRSKQINAELNNTLVMRSVLNSREEEVKVFGHMQPVVKKIEYFLRKGQPLAVVGVLSYDIATKKFRLQPFAMGYSVSQILQHFQIGYYTATIPRAFLWMLGLFGLWFAYTPLKKLFSKLSSKLFKRNATQQQKQYTFLQTIKNKVQIKTNSQHLYECVECLTNRTQIIYKCGHLCVCPECHEKNRQRNGGVIICPVCMKKSESDVRIYFG